jgi:CRP-like cAMP-binding protein
LREAIRSSFLSVLSDSQCDRILAHSLVADVPPGDAIISEADRQSCGILMSGVARIYLVTQIGGQVTVSRATAGTAVGNIGLMSAEAGPLARAITCCRVLFLDAHILLNVARSDSAVAWAIAEEAMLRLSDTYAELSGAVTGSVRQRVARALLDLAAPHRADANVVHASQNALAEMLGVARETVGHELRRLVAEGLIEQRRGQIVIHAVAHVGRLAGDFTPARDRAGAANAHPQLVLVGGAAGPSGDPVLSAALPS